jgi:hypothetical protein
MPIADVIQSTRLLAKIQTAYRTFAAGTAGVDDVPLIEAAIQPNPQQIRVRYVRGSLSPAMQGTGAQAFDINLAGPLFGSGVAGSIAANGVRGIDALLIAAGWERVTSATEVAYFPVALQRLFVPASSPAFGPASLRADIQNQRLDIKDVAGSFDVEIAPQQIATWRFRGQGVYENAVNDTTPLNGYTGGNIQPIMPLGLTVRLVRYAQTVQLVSATAGATTVFTADANISGFGVGSWVAISGLTGNWQRANGLWQVTAVSTNTFTIGLNSTGFGSLTGQGIAGGSNAQLLSLMGFRFSSGTQVQLIEDMIASTGLLFPYITGREITMELEILADRDQSGAVAWTPAIQTQDVMAGNEFGCRVELGSGTGRKWQFDVPLGQVMRAQWGERNGVRTYSMQLFAQSQGNEGEAVIRVV